jgi:hypothetical protein
VIRGLALLSSAVDIRKEIRLGVRYSDELRMSVRRRDVTLVADVGGVNVSRFEVSKQGDVLSGVGGASRSTLVGYDRSAHARYQRISRSSGLVAFTLALVP